MDTLIFKSTRFLPRIIAPLTLMVALLFSACTSDKQTEALLERAQTVMESSPDSAYHLLDSIAPFMSNKSKDLRMRHLLLSAQAQNKLYLPLPSDTLFQEVVDYYDSHGTHNQQLKAHYLLGCIYRDRGEAPLALQCYNDAVAKADTLSGDCDYTTLYKVYGQMANLFEIQVMPDEELEALKHYSEYAKKAGNTYEYIHGIGFMSAVYDLKGDTDMILSTERMAHDLYEKYGFEQDAITAYSRTMFIHMNRGDYKEARRLMLACEALPGLFDDQGNICAGREHYYFAKGLYYFGVGQFDSAEYEFKRLIPYGYTFDAYRGLIKVYEKQKNIPAALACMEKLEASFDTLVSNIHAQATRQALAMYDYNRHQRIAAQETKKSEERQHIIYTLILCFILIAAIIFQLYTKAKAKKQIEIRQLRQRLANLSYRLTRTKEDLVMMESDLTMLKKQKEEELTALQQQLQDLRDNYGQYLDNYEGLVQSQPVVNLMKKLETKTRKIQPLTEKEWREINIEFRRNMPQLHAFLFENHLLGKMELRVAILTRLEIRPDDMTLLLDVSKQSISNARANANKKLFSDNSARSLSQNLT